MLKGIKMIIWEPGNIVKCQICGIRSNPFPSRYEEMDGTAVTYRLIGCGHLLDPLPNQPLGIYDELG